MRRSREIKIQEGNGMKSINLKRIASLAVLWSVLITVSVIQAQPSSTNSGPIAITEVNVVDVVKGEIRSDQTVIITAGRITGVGHADSLQVPGHAEVINANGKYLIPGLWDMHAHLVWGDWDFSGLMVAHGITGVRDMHGSVKRAEGLRKAKKDEELIPRFIMAGNLVDGVPPMFPDANIAATPEQGRAVVDSLADAGAPFIKVYDGLEPEVYDAIIVRAARWGLPVTGHVPWQIRPAHVSDSGQHSIEHTFGLLVGCSSDEDSIVTDADAIFRHIADGNMPTALKIWLNNNRRTAKTQDDARCQVLAERLAANKTWIVPTLAVHRGGWFRNDSTYHTDPRLKFIPPKMRSNWLPENGFPSRFFKDEDWQIGQALYRRAVEVVGLLNDMGVPLLAGSDAGVPYVFPGSGLHDELELLVEAGLSPVQALRSATISPARFLGRVAEFGTIEKGKLADLVLLDASPLENISNTQRIRAVVLNGRYFDRQALDELLKEAEFAAVEAGK